MNFGDLPDLAIVHKHQNRLTTYLSATGNRHKAVILDYAKLVINNTYYVISVI
jgi:hypothetical protein